MKKLILLITAVLAAMALGATAFADYDPEADYLAAMITAAQNGDMEAGYAAETARREKIEQLGTDDADISFEDLYLLSKIIYAEAGSEWLSDEWKMCVGEVVLNRVASSEFPDTIPDVLFQSGQYYSRSSTYFANLKPSERCVYIALDLLMGERYMNDNSVVFQANFKQGSGVCEHFYDRYLGSTYFCYSSRPWLYEDEEPLEEEEPIDEEEPIVEEELPVEGEPPVEEELPVDEEGGKAVVEGVNGEQSFFEFESVVIEEFVTLPFAEADYPVTIASFSGNWEF